MKLDEIKQYKQSIDADKAWKLLQTHCKDALKNLDRPIVRGMSGTQFPRGMGLINGGAGDRESRNTSNFYTTILDAILPPLGFPKRGKSIICANWENRSHASGYGTLHAIIPFDGVKIGVCPYDDMWDTEVTLGKTFKSVQRWNRVFSNLNLVDRFSFDQLVQVLEHYRENGLPDTVTRTHESELGWLKALDKGKIKEAFVKAYSKPFKLATTKDDKAYTDGEHHEVWVGGKCIAINMKLYSKMMDNPPVGEHFNQWDDDDL